MTRGIQPENRTAPNFKRDYALIRTVSYGKNGEVQSQERREPNRIETYTTMCGKNLFI